MTATLWSCIITSIYWSILYKNDKELIKDRPDLKFLKFGNHLLPIAFLSIEWLLNRIYFETNQIWANMGVFLFYGLVNFTVTKITNEPVYPPLSFDSVKSWLLFVGMLPLAVMFYFILHFLTYCKFKMMRMNENDEY